MNNVIRRSAGRPEGSLTAVFVGPDDRVVLQVDISEGTAYVDELFLRHVVMLISDIGVAGARLVVSRATGRPTRIDRLLWREISSRLAGSDTTTLLDVLVVGEQSWWSAAGNRIVPISDAA
jgi:hypothetical protein